MIVRRRVKPRAACAAGDVSAAPGAARSVRLPPSIAFALVLLAAAPAAAETPVTIAGIGDMPTVIADQRGSFEAAGVAATVEHVPSGSAALERLLSGEADFAVTSLASIAVHMRDDETPGDPQVLASLGHTMQKEQVVARGDVAAEPADLAGARVGVPPEPSAAFFWWYFLSYHGLDPEAIQTVDEPPGELAERLSDGDLDAAVLSRSRIARAREDSDEPLAVLPEGGLNVMKCVLVTTRSSVGEDPERAERVLAGYRRAIEHIERRPEAARRVYADSSAASAEAGREAARTISYGLRLDWSAITVLGQQLEWAARTGQPASGSPASVLAALEPGPLRSLMPSAVTIPRRVEARD